MAAFNRRWQFASAFSGIGGFEVGWREFADPTVFIEKYGPAQKVLARHFPDVPLKGDISHVDARDIGTPEVAVGGFPCNQTSIAHPERPGLAGPESGYWWEFQRLLYDYLRLVDATRPRFVVIENPVGLLSSPRPQKPPKGDGVDRTGWDMAAIAAALDDLGYGWAYRVVDGKYFGTPQHRDRVIVVGHRGGDPRPALQVLGLPGAGSGPTGEDLGPAREDRPTTSPGAVRVGGDLVHVFRKSSRARGSLRTGGGWENWVAAEHSNILTASDTGLANRQTHLLIQNGRLRTLTPLEWERLQGFPDGWTEGISDSARFRTLGNAMHVGMARWLGARITAVLADLPQITPATQEV